MRTVSIKLNNEDWFVQYSPYLYYDEHCIVFSANHTPMLVNGTTITKLIDFIDYFPNYFIGSNASLPIVGGSILNHEHFQGGKHIMPMHKAKIKKTFSSIDYNEVEIGMIDWYSSAIRLVSANKTQLKALSTLIIDTWNNYDDETCDIISHTGEIRHNAVTPVARKLDNGKYCIDIILRNNRTNEQYPDGIFHVHPEFHNIKKEGIGLIEAMGLFILPGRLKKELDMIADILSGVSEYKEDENSPLYVHRFMIENLLKNGKAKNKAAAAKSVREYVNATCVEILKCTSVFKDTSEGNMGFEKFMSALNLF